MSYAVASVTREPITTDAVVAAAKALIGAGRVSALDDGCFQLCDAAGAEILTWWASRPMASAVRSPWSASGVANSDEVGGRSLWWTEYSVPYPCRRYGELLTAHLAESLFGQCVRSEQ